MALSHLLRTHTPLRLSVSLLRFSTTRHPIRTELDISHPTYMIWGSNTGVGKTLVSTALAFSVLSNLPTNFLYLKPLQTGFPVDSDSRFVHRKVSHLFCGSRGPTLGLIGWDRVVRASEGGGKGFRDLDWVEESRVSGKGGDSRLVCETLYGWKEGISPHLAAEREGARVGDGAVVESLRRRLEVGLREQGTGWKEEVWRVIETAGGVVSPGPSGTLQSDLYRPLRIPAVLVGDGRLGGISATISSYESLKLRGYDVAAVILEDHGLSNEIPLTSYLRNRVDVLVMPPIPQDPSDDLTEWFHNSKQVFNSLRDLLIASNLERIRGLHKLSEKAGEILWWPFTQHGLVPRDSVTVIDSRCGENLAVHKVGNGRELIVSQFDACASWWTQGPDAALQIELAREMGYAASRFGHVMFPENVHEPALHCAELLLKGVGEGWASRVFYSDNGSTAIEVAIKIAFRKYSRDHGIFVDRERSADGGKAVQFKVLALSGSYHGDTLGAMEAQAPSTYTSFLQQPWYSGRGLFLDPPTVFLSNGKWNISIPETASSSECRLEVPSFASCDELFYASRDTSDLAQTYSNFISKQLSQFSQSRETTHIGALIIEPVIHGAGGMHMIDPLFQRILVKVCRSHEIPVIFDEIFTGFWRLGKESAAKLLGCLPDVACFGKLMTGGIIPLAATLATEAVFDAFHGDSKAEALLHGHSYTAHAMGCTAAVKSICWFRDPHLNLNISASRDKLNELWNKEMLLKLSCHSAVKRVVALGTLCAIELKAEGADASYASLYATSLVQKLRENGIYMRPLGNVIYLMCGPCTPPQVCNEQLIKVFHGIKEFSEAQAAKHDLNVM